MPVVIHPPTGEDIFVSGPEQVTSLADRLAAIAEGIDKDVVDALAQRLGLGKRETLSVIGIDPSTFSRRKRKLNRAASDKAMLLEDIALEGEAAFSGDMEAFHEWFRSSNLLLGGKSPLSVCEFGIGIQEVQRLLARIRTADFIA